MNWSMFDTVSWVLIIALMVSFFAILIFGFPKFRKSRGKPIIGIPMKLDDGKYDVLVKIGDDKQIRTVSVLNGEITEWNTDTVYKSEQVLGIVGVGRLVDWPEK